MEMGKATATAAIDGTQAERSGGIWLALICAIVTAGVLFYLGDGVAVPLRLLGFVVGVLLPGASLWMRVGMMKSLTPAARVAAGLVLAMLAITPVYYLRRAVGDYAVLFDAALSAALLLAVMGSGSYSKFIAEFKDPVLRAGGPWMFLAIPLLFAMTWMGFEV